jgi:hypothetical protein
LGSRDPFAVQRTCSAQESYNRDQPRAFAFFAAQINRGWPRAFFVAQINRRARARLVTEKIIARWARCQLRLGGALKIGLAGVLIGRTRLSFNNSALSKQENHERAGRAHFVFHRRSN